MLLPEDADAGTASTYDDEVVSGQREPRLRVLIVGSSMGAGHVTAARVLAERIRARGGTALDIDFVELPRGHQGRLLRGFYRLMVATAPAAYGAAMEAWERHPGAFERIVATGQGGFARGLRRQIAAFRPDVIVSTYNLAGQMLGRLRTAGAIDVPVVTYVTDAGAHPYWVSRGVDLHLAPLPATARRLRALGAAEARVVQPLVDRPTGHLSRVQARRALGLPQDAPVALITGGSWGVGDVVDAAGAAAQVAVPVVLCGRSSRLHRRVQRVTGSRPVGWTDDVPTYVAAADVVVDIAGGTTTWEATLADRPVVLYRPLPGHGALNARTLADCGLAVTATSHQQLADAIVHPLPALGRRLVDAQDAASLVLSLAGDPARPGSGDQRRRAGRRPWRTSRRRGRSPGTRLAR